MHFNNQTYIGRKHQLSACVNNWFVFDGYGLLYASLHILFLESYMIYEMRAISSWFWYSSYLMYISQEKAFLPRHLAEAAAHQITGAGLVRLLDMLYDPM